MSTLTLTIVVVFVIGYLCIALETLTKVNKAAVALLMMVACWTLYMFDPGNFPLGISPDDVASTASAVIEGHLGSTATTLFFLMGAMTIVEVVDQNGGFNFVRDMMKTKSKKALLWRITILTFFLSAILDNMTTAIVMVMILRKLIKDHKDRLIYASLIIIAANSGGAFSPIGDVTTIMLWNKSLITAAGVIKELFIPSLVSIAIPAYILSFQLKGEVSAAADLGTVQAGNDFTEGQRKAVFWIGVGGLIFVPIFKSITHLPPFVGILLVLGVLWTATELFYRNLPEASGEGSVQKRITNIISRIDMGTILFFLGILMAVSCLQEVGVLAALGEGLNAAFDGNHYLYIYDDEYAEVRNGDRRVDAEHDHMNGVDASIMERIAENLPLSRERRPQWDVDNLIEMGAKNLVVDTDGRDSYRIQVDGETVYLPGTFFICVTK